VRRGIAHSIANMHYTPPVFPCLLQYSHFVATEADIIMLWPALCTAFFGFLRLGAMTSPSQSNHDPYAAVHLCFAEMSADCPDAPQVITYIGNQNTNQLRSIRIGCTVNFMCIIGPTMHFVLWWPY
jgi:hypothetical protein